MHRLQEWGTALGWQQTSRNSPADTPQAVPTTWRLAGTLERPGGMLLRARVKGSSPSVLLFYNGAGITRRSMQSTHARRWLPLHAASVLAFRG